MTKEEAISKVSELHNIYEELTEKLYQLEDCEQEEDCEWWTLDDEFNLQVELAETRAKVNLLNTEIWKLVNKNDIYGWYCEEYIRPLC